MERRTIMGKLSPRPNNKRPKYSWNELDRYLQDVLSNPTKDSVTINLSSYELSKDEIIAELKSAGYSVEDPNDGFLIAR
ncbi:hypothetical protein HPA07_05750 [Streptococcus suis]|nr:hypothetical protein [Streptococcus suis]NQH60147.1 hypothetical protein [Streptococcus suis]NQN48093.1 hypothetical protein [Streptococcus suis]NQN56055.1 hypothetical protein [Streptococcus suis]NQN76797.1 hypothetical protein [Streptococcus suis]